MKPWQTSQNLSLGGAMNPTKIYAGVDGGLLCSVGGRDCDIIR